MSIDRRIKLIDAAAIVLALGGVAAFIVERPALGTALCAIGVVMYLCAVVYCWWME